MRLFIIAAIFISSIATASANCRVYIPEREFHHDSGYSITFNFSKLLDAKKYVEVSSREEADIELQIQGNELEGRFHHAQAVMDFGDIGHVESKVTCLTQYCGISDYARAFNKAYKVLDKLIPQCN